MNNQRPATNRYEEIIGDINYYRYSYLDVDGMTGGYFIRFLPYNKGYAEHPYWLMEKIEFIRNCLNYARSKMIKRK